MSLRKARTAGIEPLFAIDMAPATAESEVASSDSKASSSRNLILAR